MTNVLEKMAAAADAALDKAYGYGLSEKGTFGHAANLSSASHARVLLCEGEVRINVLASAIHEGWGVIARVYPGQPEEKQAKRLILADTPFDLLPEEEKEKDRVSARAILAAFV